MAEKKQNTFVKWFTIILILVFLVGSIGTGIIAFLPSNPSTTNSTSK